MADAPQQVAIRLLTEGGGFRMPVDTRTGPLYRPQMGAQQGGYAATFETLYDFWIDDVPDPDQAIALNPRIREQIAMHPDVQAAMRKRELRVASFTSRFEPNEEAEDKNLAEQVSKYVEWAFNQLPNRMQLYQNMQQAVIDGGVGIEFKWHTEVNGVERPVGWQSIDKTRFIRDRQGNLALRTRIQPVWGAYVSVNPNEWLWKGFPHGKFMYHVYRRVPGAWNTPQLEGYQYWGIGEDVALYYLVTFDVFVLRNRMRYLETFASPPVDIYFPDNTQYSNPGYLTNLANSLRTQSATLLPRPPGTGTENDYFKIDYRQVPTSSYDHFAAFSDQYTLPRVSSLLLGSSDEMHKSEVGSYSGDVARQDSGPNVIFLWDALNISETFNTQLIPAIAWSRYPNLPTSYLPKHRLQPKEERDRKQDLEVLTALAALAPISAADAYEAAGVQEPAEGEKTVGGPQQGASGGMPGQPPGSPADPRKAPLTVPGRGATLRGPLAGKVGAPIGHQGMPPQMPGQRRR